MWQSRIGPKNQLTCARPTSLHFSMFCSPNYLDSGDQAMRGQDFVRCTKVRAQSSRLVVAILELRNSESLNTNKYRELS